MQLVMAGALGAALWAAQQPLDQRVFGAGYDDVELLGRAIRPRGDGWRTAGWIAHACNGALFGLASSELLRRRPGRSPRRFALGMAMAEHVALYPLAAVVDRVHPARDVLAPAFGHRQFLQATWRHLILGVVLGEVAARAERPGDGRA